MDSTRQIAIFVLLIVAAIFYADFIRWIRPPKAPIEQHSPQQRSGAMASASPGASGATGMQSSAGAGTASPAPILEAGVPEPEALTPTVVGPSPPRTVEVDTDLYQATFTAKGARLLSFRLKRYRETVRKDSPLYDVVVQGERLPLGLVISRGDQLFADQGIDYSTDAPAQIEVSPTADTTVTFVAVTKEGLKLTKRFTFRDGSYLYDIDAEVSGATSNVKAVGFNMSQPLAERAPEQGYRDYPALQADVAGKVLNEYQKQLAKGLPRGPQHRMAQANRSLQPGPLRIRTAVSEKIRERAQQGGLNWCTITMKDADYPAQLVTWPSNDRA